jgi:hypothetical protein
MIMYWVYCMVYGIGMVLVWYKYGIGIGIGCTKDACCITHRATAMAA